MWRILRFKGVLFYNYVVSNKKSNAANEIFAAFDFLAVSEWGDSNARPLRPERSALPTALHSVTFDGANIVQIYKTEKFLKIFIEIFAQIKNLSYLCTRKQDGAIAQLVEQRTENPCVPGSIPGGTTWKGSWENQLPFFVILNLIFWQVYTIDIQWFT